MDPILESSGAWQSVKESATAPVELGDGEQLAPTADGSTAMRGATVETTGSSAANAGDASVAPESRAVKPVVPEEQPVPPEAT